MKSFKILFTFLFSYPLLKKLNIYRSCCEDKKLKKGLFKSSINQLYNLLHKPTFRAVCYNFNSGLFLNK